MMNLRVNYPSMNNIKKSGAKIFPQHFKCLKLHSNSFFIAVTYRAYDTSHV